MLMEPLYEKDNATKIEAPRRKSVDYRLEETRFELPLYGVDDSLLYFSKFWYATWYTPTQYHDHFELCYVCRGEGWFILEGSLFRVGAGDIFLTKPGEIHCGGSSDDSDFVVYAFGFRLDQWDDWESAYYTLQSGPLSRDPEGAVRPFLDKLFAELERDADYAPYQARYLLRIVLVEILRLFEAQQPQAAGTNKLSPIVVQALAYIHGEQRLAKAGEAAAALRVSRSHLDREFKRQMGVNLGQYIRGICLERAKRSLRQTDRTITEIAESLQFESVQAFCVFFKRNAGIPPQRYRKQLPGPINEENR